MPIHYEQDDDHVVLITIDRPEARNAADMEHFKALREAWDRFAADDARVGRDHHGRRQGVLRRRRPQDLHPRDHEVPEADRRGGARRDRRLPPRRRHEGRAAQRAAVQADRRRGQRLLHRRRDGDARRLRHPRRVPRGEVRGDGAQARPVRRRWHDGASAASDPVAARDGVPAVRRPDPRGARVRDGVAQRGRAARAAARHGPRVRAAHDRERAARGAGDEAERAPGPVPRRERGQAHPQGGPRAAPGARPTSSRRRRGREGCDQRPRRTCSTGLGKDLRTAFEEESKLSSWIFQTEDAKEGPKAFAEKRPPSWQAK